jgi:hypothetical protein
MCFFTLLVEASLVCPTKKKTMVIAEGANYGVHQKKVTMGEFHSHHHDVFNFFAFFLDLGSLAYFEGLGASF